MRFLIAVATCVARALYAALKAVAPVRHKVAFLSRQSDSPSKDFLLLADALRARDPGLEIVMRCRMVGGSFGSRVVSAFAMVGQMYQLATSEACVVDGYVVPVSVLEHRKGLFVVQIWHALGAIKKFGYQTVGRPGGHSLEIASAMRMHRNYDLVLCGGPASVPVFAEAFGVDTGIVAPLGLPRIDYLLAAARARREGTDSAAAHALKAAHPVLADPGRKVVLYAPTHRRGGADRYRDVVEHLAGERYTLMVKPHPLESARVEGDNVVDASEVDILDLLPMCSAVVTDYSAVTFEAAAIDVPVYFYVYDVDDYIRDCGLNIDPLTEFADIASRDMGEIAARIGAGRSDPESMRLLKERYASAPEGCALRIADRILEAMRAN